MPLPKTGICDLPEKVTNLSRVPPHEKVRDARRTREAILESAERLFADRRYEGASLGDIALAAGLSRGTPSYFFGSKEQLYVEVLNRAFAERQSVTDAAFAPVRDWCTGEGGLEELRKALGKAAEGYLRFLTQRPNFARLVIQEDLSGGHRMQIRAEPSTAMQDAFETLRRAGPERGLRTFDVSEAILVFIGLTFASMSLNHTLMRSLGRDLERPAARRAQVRLAVEQLMHLLVE